MRIILFVAILILSFIPRSSQKADPVFIKYIFDIGLCISPARKDVLVFLKIGDAVQIPWRLFCSEYAIQITPKSYMIAVSRHLADMIPVVHEIFQPDIQLPGIGDRIDKSLIHRPAIKHTADDRATLDEQPYL